MVEPILQEKSNDFLREFSEGDSSSQIYRLESSLEGTLWIKASQNLWQILSLNTIFF